MAKKVEDTKNEIKNEKTEPKLTFEVKTNISQREHREFHNCYTVDSVTDDIKFLNMVYDNKTGMSAKSVNPKLIFDLKYWGKRIYYFLLSMEGNVTPEWYIKRKYEFIHNYFPDGNSHLFFLAWNGLIKNDSFKRLMLQRFSLRKYNDEICPQNIPHIGANMTRYRTKMVLADDMATNTNKERRIKGRQLNDGSGLMMQEGIVWLPNEKAIPIFPQAYVPLNQTQVILVRHGRSHHESGGDNPVFVGSGYWDSWKNNRRISGSIGNYLHEDGIITAKKLGKDFKVVVDCLGKGGLSLWSWSKENPIKVFGSESENTEQTSRYFLQEAGYNNITFNSLYGINSQKYGALTHKYKNFVEMLKKNLGNRIMLADHSGAIRVFAAIIKTLDFADYATLKEGHESIIAINYQPGMNVRYDYIQKKEYMLRKDR